MASKKTWELILQKNKKLEEKATKSLYRFLIFMIAGYVFFFSSKLIFTESYKGVNVFEIGNQVILDDIQLKLEYWSYDNEEDSMLIIISLENIGVSSDKKYAFRLQDKNGNVDTKLVYKKDDLYMIYAKGVKSDYKEVALNIINEDDTDDKIKIYGNKKTINHEKIDIDYTKKHIEEEINKSKEISYNKKLKDYEKQLKEIKKKINIANDKREKYEKSDDEEKDSILQRLETSLEEFRNKEVEIEKDIDSIKTKIDKLHVEGEE